jgi:hypothetical protein
MGVSGDGVQQFVDKPVDEDHHTLSTVDSGETTSPRSDTRAGGIHVVGLITANRRNSGR